MFEQYRSHGDSSGSAAGLPAGARPRWRTRVIHNRSSMLAAACLSLGSSPRMSARRARTASANASSMTSRRGRAGGWGRARAGGVGRRVGAGGAVGGGGGGVGGGGGGLGEGGVGGGEGDAGGHGARRGSASVGGGRTARRR